MLRDGDGGVYWLLSTLLPGFRQFRYPSKLLSFTVLAVAGLAGIGWDDVVARYRRKTAVTAATLLGWSLAALFIVRAVAVSDRSGFAAAAAGQKSIFGPFDPQGAYNEML